MGRKQQLESLKIKEDDRFPSRVSGYYNWESIRLIKSILSPKQLDLFRATCFGHFLNVNVMVLSEQFCHHVLLQECNVRDVDDTLSTLWLYIGNEVIRFSPVEFCLVTGLTFGDSSESQSNITKHMDKRTFDSLFTCLVGLDDKYKERLESPTNRKVEKYNVYGFVTAFQVWAIEAIPKWAMLGNASRVNKIAPRILNWKCTWIPSYVELYDNIFKYNYVIPSDKEARKPYWASIDQSHFPIDDDDSEDDVHEDMDNVEGDAEKKKYDDGKDDIQHSDFGCDMKKGVNTTSVKKDQVGSKKGWKRLKEMEIQLKKLQAQQDEYWHKEHDEMTSMKNEMRTGFLHLSELICKSNNEKTCHNVNTDVINLSLDDNIQFEPPTLHRVLPFPELSKANFEPSDDVQQLSRPPKITIKVTRD
ncbi:hypothetical protein LWI29_001574 [Acer saccharum]|uniref:DUF1985 domain-containing protein n=1 Tax=Acer saccharum TaxID=4024 RepID=A0AA39S5K5_ACESA|nr:hypothetical protein LWI29_001574 [Acer saccharum]